MINKHDAMSAWLGLFVGDALGVPVEFMEEGAFEPVTGYRSGGPHQAALGEWSDDGAMAMAIADCYISQGHLDLEVCRRNFIQWMEHGTYGTRPKQPAWDVGGTVRSALRRTQVAGASVAGIADPNSSGNGCIMRLAPCIVWNHGNMANAIRDAVAQALITHASPDSIVYTSALAHELWAGSALPEYGHLREGAFSNGGYVGDTYRSAWHSIKANHSFASAVLHAVNKGGDADTVGAVTGMLAGRIYGEIPQHLIDGLMQSDKLVGVGEQLYCLAPQGCLVRWAW